MLLSHVRKFVGDDAGDFLRPIGDLQQPRRDQDVSARQGEGVRERLSEQVEFVLHLAFGQGVDQRTHSAVELRHQFRILYQGGVLL